MNTKHINKHRPFEPYSIIVENREEHEFFEGIAKAQTNTKLSQCAGFKNTVHEKLWEVLDKLNFQGG